MQEFYDIFGIESHFFTVEINKFILIDVSYKTYPHWQVVEAVYDSSCAPILFKPMLKDDVLYTDGGAVANCP